MKSFIASLRTLRWNKNDFIPHLTKRFIDLPKPMIEPLLKALVTYLARWYDPFVSVICLRSPRTAVIASHPPPCCHSHSSNTCVNFVFLLNCLRIIFSQYLNLEYERSKEVPKQSAKVHLHETPQGDWTASITGNGDDLCMLTDGSFIIPSNISLLSR